MTSLPVFLATTGRAQGQNRYSLQGQASKSVQKTSEGGRQGGREREGGSRQRDSVSQRQTEAETAILRLEEEPVKSVISPGCVSRKQGRP